MRGPSCFAGVACGAFLALATVAGHADDQATRASVAARTRELKHLQQQILIVKGETRARAAKSRAAAARRRVRAGARQGPAGHRSAPPRESREAGWSRQRQLMTASEGDQQDPAPRPTPARVSDPLADQLVSATQSEVTAANLGSYLVAAWNDGEPVDNLPGGLGYGYSRDGGRTWVDGGIAPRRGEVGLWTTDPVVVADETRGWVYLLGLVTTTSSRNGVALLRGRFEAGQLVWGTPVIVRSTRDTFPDKPWIAADSASGDLHISYTTFFRVDGENTDQIEYQRSLDGGLTWTPAQRLSADQERSLVQGSRPAIGAAGEVHVVWKTIDTTATRAGLDLVRIRTSHDRGASFGPPSTVADVFTNFCSGPPGFNRGFGLGFPAIAVDRSSGPHRGRLYVTWEESLNFYDDPLGTGAQAVEIEPNAGPSQASELQLGDVVRGTIEPGRDVDWFRFQGIAGQTAVFHLDSLSREIDLSLRLWCGDGSTVLAYSAPPVVRPRVVLYTLPESGEYRLSVAPHDDSTGAYRIVTGIAQPGAERGRDHRDVFVATSDDGVAWTDPVRVNESSPRFDAWVPEVLVARDGTAFLLWYDWGDSDPGTCGAWANARLARSTDGGATWSALGPVARAPTNWAAVESNLSPNLGDYVAIVEDGRAVYPFWADGGRGDPDVLVAPWPRSEIAALMRPLATTFPSPGPRVQWQSPDSLPVNATLWRRSAWSDWMPLRSVRGDGAGIVGAIDATAESGVRYRYRLGINTVDGERTSAEVRVDVPESGPTSLAIERLLSNPARGSVRFWFRRPGDEPAIAELFDIGGRRRASRVLGPDDGRRGQLELGGEEALPGGLYLIRLRQNGRSVGARVVVLP